jgi:L-lysine 6-transaminase
MQICGILGGGKINEVETNCFHVSSRINSTWGGSLTDMVRSEKILRIIEEDQLEDHVTQMGKILQNALHNLQGIFDNISNVRGRGLFCAFDLKSGQEVQDLLKACYRNQLILLSCGERSVRFRPPLNVKESEIKVMEERLFMALKSLTA